MARPNRITLNGATFHAKTGARLLDAALAAGIDMPHDCRAGRCGSCLTRVRSGVTLGGESLEPGMIYACQAMVFSDLELEIEPTPPVGRIAARIAGLVEIARDTVELTLALATPLDIFPGQYCRFRFRGFPPRPFSPTAPLAALGADGHLRLQVKRVRDGRVTPRLGSSIGPGHQVQIEGPFGHAFLRPGCTNRLVLVGSGTGFAPIWAVAAAALRESPVRPLILISAARRLEAFYMGPALSLASRFPNVTVVAAIDELPAPRRGFVAGSAAAHMPPLAADDTVYAAGSPRLVEDIAKAALAAGATFHADPFSPTGAPSRTWLEAAKAWLRTG